MLEALTGLLYGLGLLNPALIKFVALTWLLWLLTGFLWLLTELLAGACLDIPCRGCHGQHGLVKYISAAH